MAKDGEITRVLFVCTGNICRSPSAEGVLRKMADDAGLHDRLQIDSVGIGHWHVGAAPDPRAIEAAGRRGYILDGQRARQIDRRDFQRYDLVIAMDRGHREQLDRLCPHGLSGRIRLFTEFVGDGTPGDVPDPYYGDDAGFETMMDLIEAGCRGLLAELGGGPAKAS